MALTLATVETAIESLISGSQSVTVDGMSYTKANLKTLWDMRKELKHESDRSARPMVRAVNFGGMGYSGAEKSNSTPTPVVT